MVYHQRITYIMRKIERENEELSKSFAKSDAELYHWLKPRLLYKKKSNELLAILEEFYSNSIKIYGEYKHGKYHLPASREDKKDTKIRWHTK